MPRGVRRAGRRGERGSMAVELVLWTPVLMMFIMLIVMFGRYVAVKGDVESMARDAARAASLQPSQDDARGAAGDIVAGSIDRELTDCGAGPVLTGDWRPGGQLTVRLDCAVSFDGLGLLGVPGSISVHGESTVPLDPYRRYQ